MLRTLRTSSSRDAVFVFRRKGRRKVVLKPLKVVDTGREERKIQDSLKTVIVEVSDIEAVRNDET